MELAKMSEQKCVKCDSTYKLTKHHPEGNGKGPKVWMCRVCHNDEHGIKTILNINKLKNKLKRAKRRKKSVEKTIRETQNEIKHYMPFANVICSRTNQEEKQQILKETAKEITIKCLGCGKVTTHKVNDS